jgi:SAM-dependent methyltransferase
MPSLASNFQAARISERVCACCSRGKHTRTWQRDGRTSERWIHSATSTCCSEPPSSISRSSRFRPVIVREFTVPPILAVLPTAGSFYVCQPKPRPSYFLSPDKLLSRKRILSSNVNASSDLEFIHSHRAIWNARPELREVYHSFFDQLLAAAGARKPIVEIGAGPGFFKEYCPSLISTDVISTQWVDVACDGCALPFASDSIGAFVMLDVLHHLPRPLDFMGEVARTLRSGGVVAMIEPWITPTSYVLYRWFHHEDCTLRVDIRNPFNSNGKKAFDGNAGIPYNLVRFHSRVSSLPLRLARREPFLGLPYLATLGFKRAHPLPHQLMSLARKLETLIGSIGRWNATRAVLVWEK